MSIVPERCTVGSKLFHNFEPSYNGLLRNLSVYLDGILKTTLLAARVGLTGVLTLTPVFVSSKGCPSSSRLLSKQEKLPAFRITYAIALL